MLFPRMEFRHKEIFPDSLVVFGKRVGLPACDNRDWSRWFKRCMYGTSKRAACLRIVGDRNPDPRIAALRMNFMNWEIILAWVLWFCGQVDGD